MNTTVSADEPEPKRGSRVGHWATTIVAVLAAYLISAGPVMAMGCWLRDTTGWEGFYAVFYLYLPILYVLWDVDVFEAYLMWWMKLFGTMPPG